MGSIGLCVDCATASVGGGCVVTGNGTPIVGGGIGFVCVGTASDSDAKQKPDQISVAHSQTMRRLRVWGQMAEIIQAEGILSEHRGEIGFAPFSADVTTSFRCVKTADGNVFPLTQMSRIFFVFSCDIVDGNDVVRSVCILTVTLRK